MAIANLAVADGAGKQTSPIAANAIPQYEIPEDILERQRLACERERAKQKLKAMSPEDRLEACRDYVQTVLARGDDLTIILLAPWHTGIDGKTGHHAQIQRSHGYTDHAKPEPLLSSHAFTLDELVAVLEPMGKVIHWEDKMPWDFRESRHPLDERTHEQIVGARLKQAREALGMDIPTFYAPAHMTTKTALKWEAGNIYRHFLVFGGRFAALAETHGINLYWLLAIEWLKGWKNAA